MSSREDILARCRAAESVNIEMPVLDDIQAIKYDNPLKQFISISESVGGKVVLLGERSLDDLVHELFPQAREIASNLSEVTIATRNPDTIPEAGDLDGTDVGIIRGSFGVAENGCIWIHQTMKEKAVCFISENLVIILPKDRIVSNMHEAYRMIEFGLYPYGTFISGPSKTADIAQVLVMGAQAARSTTIVLV